jgi:hypothetical protein
MKVCLQMKDSLQTALQIVGLWLAVIAECVFGLFLLLLLVRLIGLILG